MVPSAPLAIKQECTKPSFAKVAASALTPAVPKDLAVKPRAPVATPRNLALPPHKRPDTGDREAAKVLVEMPNKVQDNAKAGSTAVRTGEWTDAAVQSAAPSSDIKEQAGVASQTIALVKASAAEDSGTQLSSSDGSGKPPSTDGKSFADEKESLRPDDSASLRAVEEEDVTSPPDSVVADSRHGSDNGAARAFRDQLHEIAVMNPQPHRGVPPGRFPVLANGAPNLYDPNQASSSARPTSQPVANGIPAMNGDPDQPAIPDEKLLEALQSPRDRLFIVKLEQDFIDFIKEPSESVYALPNCNTFYRMLAHRLADYYMLGHIVDSTMTGVKITRTPYCRIPPPVSQMVDPAKGASTPPVELPARKILRRDDGKSGTNTGSNSQNPSKTTSEVGGSDGSNDGNDKEKDKSLMTREERQAHYAQTRARIFGDSGFVAKESGDGTESSEEKEKEASRSNSAAGKKGKKKMRNYDDDEFHSRSLFNAYYSGGSGFSGDNVVYYSGMSAVASSSGQYSHMVPGPTPPQSYSAGYPAMLPPTPQSQYGWPGQPYQSPNGGMYSSGPVQNGQDLSADFQRGMSSFQNAGMPSQVTPTMSHASHIPMATYQNPYLQSQPTPMNSGWVPAPPPQQQPSSYPMGQGYAGPSGPGNRPMSAPHQGPMPNAYPYGQFPTDPTNGHPNMYQHPIPGSYNRQQFNPQSQAFVPGGWGPSVHQVNHGQSGLMYQARGPYHVTNNYNHPMPGPATYGYQAPPTSPPSGSTPSFGSPQSMPGANTSHRAPPPANDAVLSNSIAKYGTPAHLPAKPPAPVPAPQSGPKLHT